MSCPYCGGGTQLLSVVSSVSVVDYYACVACDKISERSKDSPAEPIPLIALPRTHHRSGDPLQDTSLKA